MRRWYTWVIAGLLVIGVFLWMGQREQQMRMANALENSYQRDFYIVVDQVGQLKALLDKGLISGSPPQQVFLLTEVWSRANTAQNALGQLPFKELNLSASRKFLAQMGDYAYSLARQVARGQDLANEHKEQLHRFSREVGEFGQVLLQTGDELHKTGYRWASALDNSGLRMFASRKPKETPQMEQLDGFKEMDQRFDGMPVLVYDGPFSDEDEKKEPKALTGKDITQEEGENKSKEFINQEANGKYEIVGSQPVEGNIPAYGVTLEDDEGLGRVVVDIAVKGGHILSFLNSRPIGEVQLDEGEAEAKAQAFLKARGYNNMEKTYAVSENNARWIVFVALDDEIRLYPDQIKVQVALDNGEIIGFDGMMYLTNHHKRQLPKPKISPEEGAQRINPELTINSERLALIPLAGGREVLTYEYQVDFAGESYLVYINALSGEEENILQLVPAGKGELAI